jgi:phosphatidate cytidylyltransferase
MLRTRLWMGAVLVTLAIGVLGIDHFLYPWYPFLFVTVQGLAILATTELRGLLPVERRPAAWLCYGGAALLLAVNWPVHLMPAYLPASEWPPLHAWHCLLGTFIAVVLSAFVTEMAGFREPGEAVTRIALTLLFAAYLGLLPSFLIQLRWREFAPQEYGGLAVALTVFVPKVGDIGAYLTGRLLGRSRMTPILSPKKTWEGFIGGLAGAVAAAVVINRLAPAFGTTRLLPGGAWTDAVAVGFGLTVGLTGVLGDLAESLIKRDCRQKDASKSVPGFGGILDVVDSILFAAPVAYCWFLIPDYPI